MADIAEIIADMIHDAASTHGTTDPWKAAHAILAALRDAGYAVVPVVPTEKMLDAGAVADGDSNLSAQAMSIWSAMLAACPEPFTGEKD